LAGRIKEKGLFVNKYESFLRLSVSSLFVIGERYRTPGIIEVKYLWKMSLMLFAGLITLVVVHKVK